MFPLPSVVCMIKTIDVTTWLRKFMQDKTINRNSSFMILQPLSHFCGSKLIFKVCLVDTAISWWLFSQHLSGDSWAMDLIHASPSDLMPHLCLKPTNIGSGCFLVRCGGCSFLVIRPVVRTRRETDLHDEKPTFQFCFWTKNFWR